MKNKNFWLGAAGLLLMVGFFRPGLWAVLGASFVALFLGITRTK